MRVPDEITKCVVFMGDLDPADDIVVPRGTAFSVALLPARQFSLPACYLVTAKHVITDLEKISTDGKICIRANARDGGCLNIWTLRNNWFTHPSDEVADVAVCPLTLPVSKFDIHHVPQSMAVTSETIVRVGIGVGDEVFITGLFVNHFGRAQNIPIVRMGNIAMMANEPLITKDGKEEEAILIEARSIGGLSGSPAFVNTSGVRRGQVITGEGECIYWLGLVAGHWDGGLEADTATQDKGVNRGICIVVPATKILEVILQDALIAERHDREKMILAKNTPVRD
jgi:hypothetical protein